MIIKPHNTNKISLTFLGDICPAEMPFSVGLGIRTQFQKTKGVQWKDNISNIIGDSDLVVGNLEAPLLDARYAIKDNFYGNPEFASFLKDCGVNVLNVANNHTLEHGSRGFDETIKCLNNNRIGIIGKAKGDKSSQLFFADALGCKVAIAGFSNVDLDTMNNDGCFAVLSESNCLRALTEMNDAGADLKILCFHWGNEYIHRPSIDQITLAHKLIDSGVDIIIGHHPHVIQPYEKYHNGHIIYSLGNFCFENLQSKQTSIGMFATFQFDCIKKQFDEVSLSGIQLSANELVRIEDDSLFNKIYLRIKEQYAAQCRKATAVYRKEYLYDLMLRRTRERILMKLFLVQKFLHYTSGDRKILLKNVNKYYHSK